MGKYQKNGKIDFLKFLFAAVIVVHHGMQKVIGLKQGFFIGGSLAVEFFFIVSGYLFMASIQRMPERTLPLGIETGKFMLRKYKSFYPEVAIAFLIGFAVEFVVQSETLPDLWQMTFHNAFLLNMTGIGVLNSHGELWYISSMLLCMLILYPFVRKSPHIMTNVVLPLTAVLILGYFCGNETTPRNPLQWMGFTYKGNLRALAEISIGICLYPLGQRLRAMKLSKFSRFMLTVIEWGCYLCLLWYMAMESASRRDYYYVAVYAVAILISFSGQGIDASLFQNSFSSFLGRISFPLYLSHNCWAKNINTFLPEGLSRIEKLLIYGVVSLVTTAVVFGLSSLIRVLGKTLKNPAKKLLLAKEEQ